MNDSIQNILSIFKNQNFIEINVFIILKMIPRIKPPSNYKATESHTPIKQIKYYLFQVKMLERVKTQ